MRGLHQLSQPVPNHQHEYSHSWPFAEIEPAVRIGGTPSNFPGIKNRPLNNFPMGRHFRVTPQDVSGPSLLMQSKRSAQGIFKRAVSH